MKIKIYANAQCAEDAESRKNARFNFARGSRNRFMNPSVMQDRKVKKDRYDNSMRTFDWVVPAGIDSCHRSVMVNIFLWGMRCVSRCTALKCRTGWANIMQGRIFH